MKEIIQLDQHEMGFIDSDDEPIRETAQAARAVMTNEQGKIALLYFDANRSYKLPGARVHLGEDVLDALHRQVLEQTGYNITDDIREIGFVDENRYFMHIREISYAYLVYASEYADPSLDERQRDRGMELRWADNLDQALEWVENCGDIDREGSLAGLEMMKARDIAILHAAIDVMKEAPYTLEEIF